VLPAFLPAPKVQPIHVYDLAEGLLKIVERDDIPSCVLCLGSPEPISFTHFLLAIADIRVRRHRFFIPVPVVVIKLLGGAVGGRLRMRLGLERLKSLFELPVMNTACDLRRLGISLRSLPSGMHRSGDDRRRQLIGEGRALLTYVLKERPGTGLLCRYVRAVENLRGGWPLGLPTWALALPATLALFEDHAFASWASNKDFAWRLHAATALAEATTRGACRFLGLARSPSVLVSLLDIARAGLAEISWRLLRIACAPLLYLSMRNSQRRR
jgi:NADH dehydrogenase